MTFTIRDVRTNEKLVETEYSRHGSAVRSFNSRLLTPQVAYIADEGWREREAARTNLLNLEPFGLMAIPDHYLHVSQKSTYEDFLISYTESPVKGSKNLQTPGRKIGRYLKEFYPNVDENALSHAIIAAVNKLPVDVANTGAEIAAIYEECHNTQGMNSCMSYKRTEGSWSNLEGRHPTEAYGDDLKLAYLRNPKGKLIARAMIWPEKKLWNRSYGPEAAKLTALLSSAGYTQGSFKGAKLAKIEIKRLTRADRGETAFLMPYIDMDRYVHLDDKGDFRIGSHGKGYKETSQNGYILFVELIDCVTKEKLAPGEEHGVYDPESGRVVYVHRQHRVERVVGTKGREYAKRDYPTGDVGTGIWFKVDGEDGFVPLAYVVNHYYQSAFSGIWIRPETSINVYDGQVSMQEYLDHYSRCEISGVARRKVDMILMPHGKYWTRDTVDQYATRTRVNGVYVYTSKYNHGAPAE